MKKIISLILSVIMLISSVIGANAVFAQENTVKTAISTSVNTVNSCYFAADDCTMWYKFTAPSDNWFTVQVNNPYFSQTDYEYHTFITMHNSDGDEIALAGTNEFTDTCEAHAELKKGNTYYIELDNFADEGESYTVKFSIFRHIHNLEVSTYPAEVDDYAFYAGDCYEHCTICSYDNYYTIPAVKVLKLSATSYVYNGADRKPSVTVSATNGKAVSKNYYTVTYPKD
ncbi:MAG: hypothetical protein IJ235_03535 [Eubacterium sp.]|nr:hypothetical protein [Eubacterium sp.]